VIEQFLKRIAKTLDQRRIPYMIIGGQAAIVHGRPRVTQDVDITLGMDTDRLEAVIASCRALRLKLLPENPRKFSEETQVLPVRDAQSGLRVDFIFSSTPYERQAIDRATVVRMTRYPVRFASAEDVIIHKLFAGRAIDLEDARAVVLRQGARLDGAYIRKWLRSFSDVVEDRRGLLMLWEQVVRGTKI